LIGKKKGRPIDLDDRQVTFVPHFFQQLLNEFAIVYMHEKSLYEVLGEQMLQKPKAVI